MHENWWECVILYQKYVSKKKNLQVNSQFIANFVNLGELSKNDNEADS